jgi:DNA repair exonuclease SbcCD nuclease subunit
VFDAALTEDVDFVLISGGTLGAPPRGPHGLWFFAEQCARLAEWNVPVYWIEPSDVRPRWAEFVARPGNVYQADPRIGQTYELPAGGGRTVRIVAGHPARSSFTSAADVTIAVLPDVEQFAADASQRVDYWALGGRPEPGAVPAGSGLAQYAGTPQGQSPSDLGPRGCMLVTIEESGPAHSQLLPTDIIRWHDERVTVTAETEGSAFRAELNQRVQHILRAARSDAVMVRWTIEGHGPVWQHFLRDDACSRLLGELRAEFGSLRPAAWSLHLEAVPDGATRAAWERSETPFEAVAADLERQFRGAVPAGSAAVEAVAPPHYQRRVKQQALRQAAEVLVAGDEPTAA